ncbi:hypothetical protein [Flavobacterium sp.]|uniref:hypothetical protein n=1 Tax=Flavobacterium sp. TaxID=239 RepID=UPI0038FD28B7
MNDNTNAADDILTQENQKKIRGEHYISCIDNDARIDCIIRLLSGIKFDAIESLLNEYPENLRNTVNYSIMSEFLAFQKKLNSIFTIEDIKVKE